MVRRRVRWHVVAGDGEPEAEPVPERRPRDLSVLLPDPSSGRAHPEPEMSEARLVRRLAEIVQGYAREDVPRFSSIAIQIRRSLESHPLAELLVHREELQRLGRTHLEDGDWVAKLLECQGRHWAEGIERFVGQCREIEERILDAVGPEVGDGGSTAPEAPVAADAAARESGPDEGEDRLVTAKEASEVLGYTESLVRKRINRKNDRLEPLDNLGGVSGIAARWRLGDIRKRFES